MEKKKQLILLVLKLLETETDAKHPITQTEIAKTISAVYPCDRKTVGRNIQFLRDIGYSIVKTSAGFYLDKKAFALDELEFVKSAILRADGKSDEEKMALTKKVIDSLSGKLLH